ncbi:1-phosphofructokinase family hexose kinase [Corynebacterium sp.]|uniref:1-phosphofructokinase family hexose kinase n=1 Tax=Corynebacterium sp. TaxID=1720 RepID=UPI0026DBE651|nr:1-phosphofructokinase family hexose kinase [Corynebacterium sp.]MDO5075702.1 1-phosphofructokinase family hexose kinase [Corynebacterium sp.]
MILTLTPNPSIDQTLVLSEPLRPGSVQRATQVFSVAGGKGINISRACRSAGVDTLAVFPCADADPFLRLLHDIDVPHHAVHMPDTVRTNTTVTTPGGETTKLNGPGPTLSAPILAELERVLIDAAAHADAVILAGSLPQGTPEDWYVTLIAKLRSKAPDLLIAVDSSDGPLRALANGLECGVAPSLLKPNGLELGQLIGADGEALEAAAQRGEYAAVVEAAKDLVRRGITEVLVSLGAAGAALVTEHDAWIATPPRIECVSTVGAGDSTLAGYVMSRTTGADHAQALKTAVAYGAAAASLPGTAIPTPNDLHLDGATVAKF